VIALYRVDALLLHKQACRVLVWVVQSGGEGLMKIPGGEMLGITGPGRPGTMTIVNSSEPTAGRVLIVEDERALAGMIGAYLSRAGFETALVYTGSEAVAAARDRPPDVVILDLGLPGMDGIEVCRQIRTFSDCYIIMATARTGEIDTLIGLSVGADDYVVKPFSIRELVARVQVVLRRPRRIGQVDTDPVPAVAVFGELRVDAAGRQVHLAGEPVPLTPTEREILIALATRPGLALTRRQLIDVVWGDGWLGDERLVDVHIAQLRKKLGDDPAAARYVTTVRGIGYRMGNK
jgi:DNA-binding response OmpR family regulator